MKIRLHEIEFGATEVEKTKHFYQAIFGFETTIDQPNLTVFNLATSTVDFNISTHFAPQTVCISFLTDNLEEMIERLTSNAIKFEGPKDSHLGMLSIAFQDPNGNLIKVNQPSDLSPNWLK